MLSASSLSQIRCTRCHQPVATCSRRPPCLCRTVAPDVLLVTVGSRFLDTTSLWCVSVHVKSDVHVRRARLDPCPQHTVATSAERQHTQHTHTRCYHAQGGLDEGVSQATWRAISRGA